MSDSRKLSQTASIPFCIRAVVSSDIFHPTSDLLHALDTTRPSATESVWSANFTPFMLTFSMSVSTSPQIPNLIPPSLTEGTLTQKPRSARLQTLHRRILRKYANKATSKISEASPLQISEGSNAIREFYDGINRHDLGAVERLIGEGCVYEDLVFSRPFVGRKAILEFFKKFTESISKDLQFVIDDISNEDSLAVGVTWHLEWQGRPFPFSRGCSFYRLEVLDGRRQIIYGRDCVEPATKPGEVTLVILGGLTWILQQFPQLADRL